MGLSRRRFTRDFKLTAVRQLEQGIGVGEVARALEVNPDALHRWRREVRQGPGNAFPGGGNRRWSEGRMAELERKIGRQALEIDFLKGCLQRIEEQRMLQALTGRSRSTARSAKRCQGRSKREPLGRRKRGPLSALARGEDWAVWGRLVVQANIRGRDLGTSVADAQTRLARAVTLPPEAAMVDAPPIDM